MKRDIVISKQNVGNKAIAEEVIAQVKDFIDGGAISNLSNMRNSVVPYVRTFINEKLEDWNIENSKVQADEINNPAPDDLPIVILVQYKRSMSLYPTSITFTVKEAAEVPVVEHDRFGAWR